MNLQYLKYLVAVAECGSIHEAAQQLLLKRQYVSNVIKTVEEKFGTEIFERQPRGVVLTEDGSYLIEKAKQILQLYDEMEDDFLYPSRKELNTCSDEIHIYMPPYLGISNLVKALEEYEQLFPNVNVSVLCKNKNDIHNVLQTEKNSLTLYFTHQTAENLQAHLFQDLYYELVGSTSLILACAKANQRVKQYSEISIEDALKLNLAFFAPEGLENAPFYHTIRYFGEPNIRYTVDNFFLLFQFLQTKNCYTIVNRDIIAQNDVLLGIPFSQPINSNVFLIYQPELSHSYAFKSLLKVLKKYSNIG